MDVGEESIVTNAVRRGQPAARRSVRSDGAPRVVYTRRAMKGNIPIAQHAQESAGVSSDDSALIEIGGLGDEALWTNVNGALSVRRGNLMIQVMAPRDRKKQIAVADKLLALMR